MTSRGLCDRHSRAGRAAGTLGVLVPTGIDPATGRETGRSGRSGRLPGQYAIEKRRARSRPLARFMRHGTVPASTRRHVESVGAAVVASLGGAENLSAQDGVLIEKLLSLEALHALALDEVRTHRAFATTENGRTIGAGFAAALKASAEIRQILSLLGVARRSAPAQSVDQWLKAGDPDAPIPAESVEVSEA
jgi:hypothetical protein